jgi:hypothetical protein
MLSFIGVIIVVVLIVKTIRKNMREKASIKLKTSNAYGMAMTIKEALENGGYELTEFPFTFRFYSDSVDASGWISVGDKYGGACGGIEYSLSNSGMMTPTRAHINGYLYVKFGGVVIRTNEKCSLNNIPGWFVDSVIALLHTWDVKLSGAEPDSLSEYLRTIISNR